ncbi:putative Ubiquitin carboxyl-terminal hydrolase 47 [Blattamonas nauphoetae]|uniref:Ubiquitin carboxyl-terminal hydrolase 47 n=1 Tax=Blattamonas nauphoetae TaxID=2049346 RepID=A0ABQ9WWU2_9EUKA|nr:putative Ubiquitin carboxyl-terminal hydrolase 47 [Blattamonas nauphoetae]
MEVLGNGPITDLDGNDIPYSEISGYSLRSTRKREAALAGSGNKTQKRTNRTTSNTSPAKTLRRQSFIGLINQGATCFLNSLIQALYQIPEFRLLIFSLPTLGEGTLFGEENEEEDAKPDDSEMIKDEVPPNETANASYRTTDFSTPFGKILQRFTKIPHSIKKDAVFSLQYIFAKMQIFNNAHPPNSTSLIDLTSKEFQEFPALSSSMSPYSTRDLTDAFGWGEEVHYEHHDVGELHHLLCDLMETKEQNAFEKCVNSNIIPNHALSEDTRSSFNPSLFIPILFTNQTQHYVSSINTLFRGSYRHFTECLTCHSRTSHSEPFLELNLPIRGNIGRDDVFPDPNSLSELLHTITAPESLVGDNLYTCATCKSKREALMRYEYDSNWNRIKVNDFVKFPLYLDCSPWVVTEDEKKDDTEEIIKTASEMLKDEDTTQPSVNNDSPQQSTVTPSAQPLPTHPHPFPTFLVSSPNPHPLLYELSSVTIHSGTTEQGHYYVYVRDFETGDWVLCNDAYCAIVDESEATSKTYGTLTPQQLAREKKGGRPSTRSSDNANDPFKSCAYRLIYRRVETELVTQDELTAAKRDYERSLDPAPAPKMSEKEGGRADVVDVEGGAEKVEDGKEKENSGKEEEEEEKKDLEKTEEKEEEENEDEKDAKQEDEEDTKDRGKRRKGSTKERTQKGKPTRKGKKDTKQAEQNESEADENPAEPAEETKETEQAMLVDTPSPAPAEPTPNPPSQPPQPSTQPSAEPVHIPKEVTWQSFLSAIPTLPVYSSSAFLKNERENHAEWKKRTFLLEEKKAEIVTEAHSQTTTPVSTDTATPADPSATPQPSPTDPNPTKPKHVVPSQAAPMGDIFTFQNERGEFEIVDFAQQHRIENGGDETDEETKQLINLIGEGERDESDFQDNASLEEVSEFEDSGVKKKRRGNKTAAKQTSRPRSKRKASQAPPKGMPKRRGKKEKETAINVDSDAEDDDLKRAMEASLKDVGRTQPAPNVLPPLPPLPPFLMNGMSIANLLPAIQPFLVSGNEKEKGRGTDKTAQQTPSTPPPPQHILRIIPFFHTQLPLSLIPSDMQSFLHLEEGIVASEQELDRIEKQKWAFVLMRDQLDVRTFSIRTQQDDPFSLLRQNIITEWTDHIISLLFPHITPSDDQNEVNERKEFIQSVLSSFLRLRRTIHPIKPHLPLPSFEDTLYNTSTIPATPSSSFNMTAAHLSTYRPSLRLLKDHLSTPVNMLFTSANTCLFADIDRTLVVGLETGAINDLDSFDEYLRQFNGNKREKKTITARDCFVDWIENDDVANDSLSVHLMRWDKELTELVDLCEVRVVGEISRERERLEEERQKKKRGRKGEKKEKDEKKEEADPDVKEITPDEIPTEAQTEIIEVAPDSEQAENTPIVDEEPDSEFLSHFKEAFPGEMEQQVQQRTSTKTLTVADLRNWIMAKFGNESWISEMKLRNKQREKERKEQKKRIRALNIQRKKATSVVVLEENEVNSEGESSDDKKDGEMDDMILNEAEIEKDEELLLFGTAYEQKPNNPRDSKVVVHVFPADYPLSDIIDKLGPSPLLWIEIQPAPAAPESKNAIVDVQSQRATFDDNRCNEMFLFAEESIESYVYRLAHQHLFAHLEPDFPSAVVWNRDRPHSLFWHYSVSHSVKQLKEEILRQCYCRVISEQESFDTENEKPQQSQPDEQEKESLEKEKEDQELEKKRKMLEITKQLLSTFSTNQIRVCLTDKEFIGSDDIDSTEYATSLFHADQLRLRLINEPDSVVSSEELFHGLTASFDAVPALPPPRVPFTVPRRILKDESLPLSQALAKKHMEYHSLSFSFLSKPEFLRKGDKLFKMTIFRASELRHNEAPLDNDRSSADCLLPANWMRFVGTMKVTMSRTVHLNDVYDLIANQMNRIMDEKMDRAEGGISAETHSQYDIPFILCTKVNDTYKAVQSTQSFTLNSLHLKRSMPLIALVVSAESAEAEAAHHQPIPSLTSPPVVHEQTEAKHHEGDGDEPSDSGCVVVERPIQPHPHRVISSLFYVLSMVRVVCWRAASKKNSQLSYTTPFPIVVPRSFSMQELRDTLSIRLNIVPEFLSLKFAKTTPISMNNTKTEAELFGMRTGPGAKGRGGHVLSPSKGSRAKKQTQLQPLLQSTLPTLSIPPLIAGLAGGPQFHHPPPPKPPVQDTLPSEGEKMTKTDDAQRIAMEVEQSDIFASDLTHFHLDKYPIVIVDDLSLTDEQRKLCGEVGDKTSDTDGQEFDQKAFWASVAEASTKSQRMRQGASERQVKPLSLKG